MIIGLPKEINSGERRVLLNDISVLTLTRDGHTVWVEDGAGMGVGITNDHYEKAGAKIVGVDKAWSAGLVCKLKPPTESEFHYLRPGMVISAIFHAEGDEVLTNALRRSRVTAYSYEFFQNDDGSFPLMVAGSTIAGYQAVNLACMGLQSQNGGSGLLLLGLAGCCTKVLIVGSGNLGIAAAEYASQLGADVTVLCSSEAGAKKFKTKVSFPVRALVNCPAILADEIKKTDVLIGAILISTFDTPEMITLSHVKSMKKGAVLIDATCGYGSGYIATSYRETTLEEPFYVLHDVVHAKIPNLPAGVPVSSVQMSNQVYLPYLQRFILSLEKASYDDPISARGKIVDAGSIVHPELAKHYNYWNTTNINISQSYAK